MYYCPNCDWEGQRHECHVDSEIVEHDLGDGRIVAD